MRTHTRLTLTAAALAALAAPSAPARAQETDAWIEVSPEGESFVVKMPAHPEEGLAVRLSAGELEAGGRLYVTAGAGGAAYFVLSLRDSGGAAERLLAAGYQSERFRRESRYLDEIAELAQAAVARPDVRLPGIKGDAFARPHLSYRREFELSGRAAREYLASSPRVHGPVYVCADGQRIYVVGALGGGEAQSSSLKQFVDSFEIKAEAPAPPAARANKPEPDAANGTGIGPGSGRGVSTEDAGYGPFASADVTERARLTSRPEPVYTEEARKFLVRGTVSLRVVLGASGEVERVDVLKGLPHGMTLAAVEAARKIAFEPARKDGRPVPQYVAIQYNFNIY